jgi:hypothetical protein
MAMAACGTGTGTEEAKATATEWIRYERERDKRVAQVNAAEGRGTLVFSQCASTLVA